MPAPADENDAHARTARGALLVAAAFGIFVVTGLAEGNWTTIVALFGGLLLIVGVFQVRRASAFFGRTHRILVTIAVGLSLLTFVLSRFVLRTNVETMNLSQIQGVVTASAVNDVLLNAIALLALAAVATWPGRALLGVGVAGQVVQSGYVIAAIQHVVTSGSLPADYDQVALVTTLAANVPVVAGAVLAAYQLRTTATGVPQETFDGSGTVPSPSSSLPNPSEDVSVPAPTAAPGDVFSPKP